MSNNLDQNQIKSLLQPIIDTKMLSGIVIRGEKLDLIIELSNQTSVDQQNITKKIEDILYLNFKELKEIRVIFMSWSVFEF
jgi:hypothetical protein